ncbi:hypothetical protein [Paludisphaera rhizosphaerae]|uniref:hypothetical protein n=1 Tax=Paludisphaera rhizosphaerae TaxID=2711216 RepID=UPI0013EE2855|nr:hypothetical protein [Paludisphaera rhizosphaerae]
MERAPSPRDRIPRPKATRVTTFAGEDGEPFSFITRIWWRSAAKRCTLCPTCNSKPMTIFSLCAVVTPGFISDEDAEMHRFEPGDSLPETKVEIHEVEQDEDEED